MLASVFSLVVIVALSAATLYAPRLLTPWLGQDLFGAPWWAVGISLGVFSASVLVDRGAGRASYRMAARLDEIEDVLRDLRDRRADD